MNAEEKVKAFVEKEELIREGDRILLGLSGGADSVCLFYLLLALREKTDFGLRAVHVHHGIRPEAEEDVSFVKELCGKENVVCHVFRENVPAWAKERGIGEEEAGRELRYRDFQEALKKWQEEEAADSSRFKIATAHHENDQAETVLFQLFRGCGLSGLRGILPRRDNIIRPMLCLSREEIEEYLKKRGVSWCEDRTNMLEDYSRNRIRHQILPCAEREISRHVSTHIRNTAQILRDAERYIRGQTIAAFRRTASEREGVLFFDIPALLKEDIFLKNQVLLYGMERLLPARKDIGTVHVGEVLKLAGKQGNGELHLPGGLRARKVYGKLLLFRAEKEEEALEALSQDEGLLYGEKEPAVLTNRFDLSDEKAVTKCLGIRNISEILDCIPQKTYTKWFDYDKIETSFLVRHRKSGDYLTIDKQMNRKSFQRYLMENKVPAAQRDLIWVIADGAHVMWVPGGRMSAYYKVTDQTKTILQIQICEKE